MKPYSVVLMGVFLALVLSVTIVHAKTVPDRKSCHFEEAPQLVPLLADFNDGPALSSAAADTFNLGWFGFDVAGLPNPQGWVTVDLTAQQTFFHVASNTPVTGELNGGTFGNLVPLDGNKSLWVGQAASTDPLFCGWATLPGYGNNWDQIMISNTLAGDSVRTSYKVFWDSEPGYDATVYQFSGDGGATWTSFPVGAGLTQGIDRYDLGPTTLVETFMQGGLASVTLRFRFQADDGPVSLPFRATRSRGPRFDDDERHPFGSAAPRARQPALGRSRRAGREPGSRP